MTRIRLVCALALVVAIPAMTTGAYAADTADITVTVTIQNLSLTLSSATWAIGTVVVGSTSQMTEATDITVTNNGNVDEDFTLRLTNSAAWTAGATAAANVFVLSGLYCDAADAPGGGDFNAEDVMTTSAQTATATIFGYAGGAADGVGVVPTAAVDLWLEFQAPTSTGDFTEQTITVTVGAVAS